MQLQDLLTAARHGSSRLARLFFQENQDFMQKYVDTSLSIVSLVLNPLNSFMKHLLTIQDLDPNSVPGEKARKALQDALMDQFKNEHSKEYDDDYDFDRHYKKFEDTRKQLANQTAQVALTKEMFKELTDLNKLPGGFVVDGATTVNSEADFFNRTTEVNKMAPESEKKELVLAANAIDDLRKSLRAIEQEILPKVANNPQKDTKKPIRFSNKKRLNKKITQVGPSKKTVAGSTQNHIKLVNDMVAKGLCSSEPEAMARQIQEIAYWDDKAFEAMERVVSRAFSKVTPKFNGPFRRAPKE